ncbi:macrophage-expressed gene 1 protein-like isoform X3 [Erpetoichthys calabaricus]|uniref:macrophage-expressed gene 1 protein-like isoform X3 n=1 Tax=Erpetoichthys calabaricus TaxID=27687 RepID=UPI00223405E5|nr:macrophage-expressed gene 1 protein-like isoform X3 [Erpetoichthys calabaricus]
MSCSLLFQISLMSFLIQQLEAQGSPLQTSVAFQECKITSQLAILETLPGGGWDNLRNADMGRVMNFSYSTCQTTEDGLYLIPDEVFVIPQKQTKLELNTEIIENWMELKSSVAETINSDLNFIFVLNGKFSKENQRVKSFQVQDQSSTTRVQVRNLVYIVKTNPNFSFDARFKRQIMDIANALENNQTKEADYLSEMLVQNFGTHVITNVDAGAILLQEDYVRSSFITSERKDITSIKSSAGISFFNKINIGFDAGVSRVAEDTLSKRYAGNVTHSLVQVYGSIPFYPGITLKTWQEGIFNNLVAIDRSGLPLHSILNKESLPDLPALTAEKVSQSVEKAIMMYYTVNQRPGCLKSDSTNFNFQANVDDGSCEGVATNLSFGGVYQVCTPLTSDAYQLCSSLEQKNPLTGSFSCPPTYNPVRLRTQEKQEDYSQHECHKNCHRCWIFATCCDNSCETVYYTRRAIFTTYWCAATNETVKGSISFLFGGLYSSSSSNLITKSQSCPTCFTSLKILQDVNVCVSSNKDRCAQYSVVFGGFFSCEATNPLAGESRTTCANGFSQYSATISDGCQILYCITTGLFKGGQLLPIKVPPFSNPYRINNNSTNDTMVTPLGRMLSISNKQSFIKVNDVHTEYNGLTSGAAAGVAIAVLVLLAVIITLAVFGVRRYRKRVWDEVPSRS